MTDTLTKTIILNAPRETVWDFLTDSDKLASWFHPAEADLVEGEEYCLVRNGADGNAIRQIWGRVLEAKPPDLLRYTFIIGPFDETPTTVTWRLDEVAGGTRLTLTHEGIAHAARAGAMDLLRALDHGWDEHLAQLRGAMG